MYNSSQSQPWRRRRRERPCGLMYNTGYCPDVESCHFSHEPRDIQSWRDSRGLVPCANGPMCNQFITKECVYDHPSSPSSSKYRNKKSKYYTLRINPVERQQRMMDGLVFVRSIVDFSVNGPFGASPGVFEIPQHFSISNEKFLASYNKLGDNKIAVPGFPQQFVPPTETLSVKLDADEHVDPKNVKDSRRAYPTYTHNLEPLVCAVQCMTKNANHMLDSTDIVANVGSLYRLFHYLSGDAVSSHRFDLEWRPNGNGSDGGTLLMQQWNADPDHKVSFGRGNNFAQMTCKYPDDTPEFLKDSFTHHRVLSYGFGNLQCVIHCEADGFYEPAGTVCTPSVDLTMTDAGRLTPPPTRRQSFARTVSHSGPDRHVWTPMPPTPPMMPREIIPSSVGSRFALLDPDFSEDSEDDDTNVGESDMLKSDTLSITPNLGTRTISTENYIEIKTFSKTRRTGLLIPPEPQLYFGRTKQLYRTGHRLGCFQASGSTDADQVQDMTETLRQWENSQQDVLARLHSVLLQVRRLASEMADIGHTKLCLVYPGPDESATVPMRVFIRHDEHFFLPANL